MHHYQHARRNVCSLFLLLLFVLILVACARNLSQQTSTAKTYSVDKVFVGTWYIHGGALTVQGDGRASYIARAYRWCSDAPPPCDKFVGNLILSGIHEDIVFTKEQAHVLYGTVTASTNSTTGQIAMLVTGQNNTVLFNRTTFCGPHSPTEYCGA